MPWISRTIRQAKLVVIDSPILGLLLNRPSKHVGDLIISPNWPPYVVWDWVLGVYSSAVFDVQRIKNPSREELILGFENISLWQSKKMQVVAVKHAKMRVSLLYLNLIKLLLEQREFRDNVSSHETAEIEEFASTMYRELFQCLGTALIIGNCPNSWGLSWLLKSLLIIEDYPEYWRVSWLLRTILIIKDNPNHWGLFWLLRIILIIEDSPDYWR